eukprot:6927622-Pyramimonas_sp.AAC.1
MGIGVTFHFKGDDTMAWEHVFVEEKLARIAGAPACAVLPALSNAMVAANCPEIARDIIECCEIAQATIKQLPRWAL